MGVRSITTKYLTMVIEQIIRDDDNNIIAKNVAFGFEGAEENLGKLERYYSSHVSANGGDRELELILN